MTVYWPRIAQVRSPHLFCPLSQPEASLALNHMLASGEHLVIVVGRNPKIMSRKAGPAVHEATGLHHHGRGCRGKGGGRWSAGLGNCMVHHPLLTWSWHDLVGHGPVADPVDHPWEGVREKICGRLRTKIPTLGITWSEFDHSEVAT